MESTIRLFKAVPITRKNKKKAKKSLLEKTISKGFIFAPEVIANYNEKELLMLINLVEKEIGLSAGQMNSSFHKSWKKVYENTISLNSILEAAGAKLVTDKTKCDIDLSPENIEKDTILDLLRK